MKFPFIPENNELLNALCIEDEFYSYSFFRTRVNSIAFEITAQQMQNTAIGVVANDNIDTYAAIIAIWATGNTYIPINPYHPSDRINSIIEQAEIKIIFYNYEKIDTNTQLICTKDLEEKSFEKIATPKDEDIAYILFTSGSTGVPKGVPVSYGNVRSFIRHTMSMSYNLSAGDKFLQMFDLSFDLSIVSILMPFIFNGCMFTVPNNNIKYQNVYRLLEEYDINFAVLVPSVAAYLQPYFDEICLEKIRYVGFCGEALLENITKEFIQCCPNAEIDNLYGPTEATVYTLWYRAPKKNIASHNGIISIGKPTLETNVLIVDEENNILPDGEKGELLLGGTQVISAYLKNEQKNKEAFLEINKQKYYRTGDICLRKDDLYYYLGRKDFQVKVRGFRVELSEIEHHIATFYNKKRVVAFAFTDRSRNEILVAAIESEQIKTDDLNIYLKSKIPYYMIPSEYSFFSTFPLNNNGKIDRKQIENIILSKK